VNQGEKSDVYVCTRHRNLAIKSANRIWVKGKRFDEYWPYTVYGLYIEKRVQESVFLILTRFADGQGRMTVDPKSQIGQALKLIADTSVTRGRWRSPFKTTSPTRGWTMNWTLSVRGQDQPRYKNTLIATGGINTIMDRIKSEQRNLYEHGRKHIETRSGGNLVIAWRASDGPVVFLIEPVEE
jgi:hypothetical protein